MEKATTQTPQARTEGLLVQEVQDEILVYDLKRHWAFCLNKAAAAIWESCDGQTPVAEIIRTVEKKLQVPMNEQLVWLTLDKLGKSRLLCEQITQPSDATPRISRRKAMRKIGGAAVIALPLITSVITPTAVQAATICRIPNTSCTAATIGCCCTGNSKKCVADAGQPDGASCKGSAC